MERWQWVAFRHDDVRYRLADALLCAQLAGEWAALESGIRAGAACERRAAEEGSPLAEGEVAGALRTFRYDRNLIAAEEAEAWLDAWELTPEQWSAALERRLLRARWAGEADAVLGRYAPDDAALAEVAWPDLLCSGELDTLVRRLAERVAIASGDTEGGTLSSSEAPAGPLLPPWLGISQDARDPVCGRLARLVAVTDARRRQWPSPEVVRAAIAARPLDWTYVETVRLVLPEEAMAAEAALRVREDGETLDAVAHDVGRPVERWNGLLESADRALRARLAGAAEGELLGPLPDTAGHALVQVAARRAPRPSDPVVRAHAERYVWAQVTSRALETIQWELPQLRGLRG